MQQHLLLHLQLKKILHSTREAVDDTDDEMHVSLPTAFDWTLFSFLFFVFCF